MTTESNGRTPHPHDDTDSLMADDPRDRFVDVYLAAQLGNEQPPDLQARILAALQPGLARETDTRPDPTIATNKELTVTPTELNRFHASGWRIGLTMAATLLVAALLGAVMWLAPTDTGDNTSHPQNPGPAAQPGPDDAAPPQPQPEPETAEWTPPVYQQTADTPVLAGNRVVNPRTGQDLGPIAEMDGYIYLRPVAGYPGIFRNAEIWVDAVASKVIRREAESYPTPGKVWCFDGITYRFARTATGPKLMATRDNKVIWTVDAQPAATWARLTWCDTKWITFEDGYDCRLLDCATGKTLQRVEGCTISDVMAVPDSDNLLLVVNQDWAARIERRAPDGTAVWSHELEWADAGGSMGGARLMIRPASGATAASLIVCGWEPISDSGVAVECLALADGKAIWSGRCANLGVPHSKYSHSAYSVLRGDNLCVVSQAAGGTFVETRRLGDGESLTRYGPNSGLKYELERVNQAAKSITVYELGEPVSGAGQAGPHFMGRSIIRSATVTDAMRLSDLCDRLCDVQEQPERQDGAGTNWGAHIEASGVKLDMWIRPAEGWTTIHTSSGQTAIPIDGPSMQKMLHIAFSKD